MREMEVISLEAGCKGAYRRARARAHRFERSLTSRYNFTKNSEPLGEMN